MNDPYSLTEKYRLTEVEMQVLKSALVIAESVYRSMARMEREAGNLDVAASSLDIARTMSGLIAASDEVDRVTVRLRVGRV